MNIPNPDESSSFFKPIDKQRQKSRFSSVLFINIPGEYNLRTFLFWLAPLFLLAVSGTLSTDFSQKHYKKSDTSFSDLPETHAFLDCKADESLNEFEEEDERVEETEKNSKKSGFSKTGLCSYRITDISEIFSVKFSTYRIRNTYRHFYDHSINANAPPAIS